MKKILWLVLAATILFFILLITQRVFRIYRESEQQFKLALDSLQAQNDSLTYEIMKEDLIIDSLMDVDFALQDKITHQKDRVIVITRYVDSLQKIIDTYSEEQLIASLYQRYPLDTVTNKLPVAEPVLIAAARDLVELDGAKQTLKVKDSVIALQDFRLSIKDTIINSYFVKEENYKQVVSNKNLQLTTWENQYNQLRLENKKLKLKAKVLRIASAAIIGGLTVGLIAK